MDDRSHVIYYPLLIRAMIDSISWSSTLILTSLIDQFICSLLGYVLKVYAQDIDPRLKFQTLCSLDTQKIELYAKDIQEKISTQDVVLCHVVVRFLPKLQSSSNSEEHKGILQNDLPASYVCCLTPLMKSTIHHHCLTLGRKSASRHLCFGLTPPGDSCSHSIAKQGSEDCMNF